MEERLIFLAHDIVKLYSIYREKRPIESLKAFDDLWVSEEVEYFHYIGSDITQPWIEEVTQELLQLAVAHISFPHVGTAENCGFACFGILLSYFLFHTQPPAYLSSHCSSSDVSHFREVESISPEITPSSIKSPKGDNEKRYPTSATCKACRAVVPCDDVILLLEAFNSLSSHPVVGNEVRLCTKVMKSLYKSYGWEVLPFVKNGLPLTILLRAYESHHIPLILASPSPIPFSIPQNVSLPEHIVDNELAAKPVMYSVSDIENLVKEIDSHLVKPLS